MKKTLLAISIILVLAILGFAGYKIYALKKYPKSNVENKAPPVNRTEESNLAKQELNSGKIKTFQHPRLNFSFQYPENFALASMPDEEGEALLLQKGNIGFQIYIKPIAETVEVTAEMVRSDIPDMKVDNAFYIDINGAKALVFDSENDAKLKTGEIWFSRKGQLYQITTYREFAPVLADIVKSWKWNN